MLTGRTRYSGNMSIIAFSYIKFEFTSVKQTALNKQGFIYKNTYYKWVVHIFRNGLT